MTATFPDGFIWGTATAAHQVEGGNVNNDWWDWEHNPNSGCKEPSGDACDSYHRFAEDVRISADLGLPAYRFSVEWSRIEPANGEWSIAALDHYKRCCGMCWEAGVTPMVTFHHFTTPRWLAAAGGWENPTTADHFARFSERTVHHLGDVIGRAFTLNEPNVVAAMGHLLGAFPPGKTDMEATLRASATLADAHIKGRDAIKAGPGDFEVGLTLAMFEWEAVDGGTEADIDKMRADYEDAFLGATRGDDFLGVQTYTRMRVGPGGAMRGPEKEHPLTKFGWEDRPEALAWTVRRAFSVLGGSVPILVTENGISTDDDERRIAFTREALEGIRSCIDDGVDVRGYIHWTLLDNFEWTAGFEQTFGLVAVDRTTFERHPKPSAEWFGRCAKANAIVD